jgi:hypothetical protein
MKIIGVPGIHSEGVGNTDLLGNMLATRHGYNFMDLDLPIRGAWGARWKAEKDAKEIIAVANDGDAVIAHSYGCLKACIAMREVRFHSVFLFRPAMSRRYRFHRLINGTKVYCIYSPGDIAIWLGSILLFHPFGLAGAKGFKDRSVINVPSHSRHNHDFSDKHIEHWDNFVHSKIRARTV